MTVVTCRLVPIYLNVEWGGRLDCGAVAVAAGRRGLIPESKVTGVWHGDGSANGGQEGPASVGSTGAGSGVSEDACPSASIEDGSDVAGGALHGR